MSKHPSSKQSYGSGLKLNSNAVRDYLKDDTIVISYIGSKITELINNIYEKSNDVSFSRVLTANIIYDLTTNKGRDLLKNITKEALNDNAKACVEELADTLLFGNNNFILQDLKRFGLNNNSPSLKIEVMDQIKHQSFIAANIFCSRFLDKEYSNIIFGNLYPKLKRSASLPKTMDFF
ncbi:unnamed protein product [Brachionus calyciflorus]|uniref:Uncharacterized protein n=1 Tax=Brachionus calyciflorus TaxID=104777 RepID=A0A814EV40_9BILA|nr:unnamed protein product [Brachionus calyciflorus]